MLYRLERFTERMSERPSEKNGPRRLDCFGIFTDNRDAYRRDAGFFYHPLYQSDGLITNASGGSQQNNIHAVRL